ncbi:MAG: ACP S-malonyltransferase [Phycisphaerae bacterium]
MSKTAILFPGQGAQTVGMGRDFAEFSEAARKTFADADEILETDLTRVCFEGPADRLNATDCSQPAIFVTSVAIWRALEEKGIVDDLRPQVMAGLSLGEYTALHLAGWMNFEDGLRLVAERGRLMQAAAESTSGGMVSIMGLSEAEVLELCQEASEGEVLAPANFNCPSQIVISGAKTACERAVALAERYKARAIPLVVAGAFHSPLMKPAENGLRIALERVKIESREMGVVSNVSADYHGDSDDARRLLTDQVTNPVRWQASIERLRSDRVGRFIEVGPGRVLTGLMRKIDRSATAINMSRVEALAQVSA